jgi:hypothetical protein
LIQTDGRLDRTKGADLSIRLNVVLSDDLNHDIDRVAGSAENKSEVFRKALQLYLVACDAQTRGLKLGLFEPGAQTLQTEITGL